MQYDASKRMGIIAGFDIGQDRRDEIENASWYSPVLIVRYTANAKTKIAIRAEQYHDKKNLFIPTEDILGFSTNIDRQINDKIQLRLEGKILHADDAIFSFSKKDNFSLTTNLTIRI